ncbi:IspD/TarI family cytidylyltransferase [Nonomuraea turcica]|uniref:IspD/TarI family cytidylyltransferase n=1 Tax=Nonomuraea sp. G32 TaxID=3067274 RepID=UPI00273BB2F4|nr:2-C-methyl-D-erythritol 4-phosphate cytidylyltransferase [Nonomuraea sp. G32]MDP4511984.1 2-C-methyl-D-erythritol 4-phosphate cytidylyltransferase [Nonomuraea sp. G32]
MDEAPNHSSADPPSALPAETMDPLSRERVPGSPHAAGVVLVSGESTAFAPGLHKAYLPLLGRSLMSWALRALAATKEIGPLLLVVPPEDYQTARRLVAREADGLPVEIVLGRETRQESQLLALRHLAGRIDTGAVDVVVIHDVTRPLASSTLTAGVIHAARMFGGAIPGLLADDLVKADADDMVIGSPQRLLRPQTPQAFEARSMLAAFEAAARDSFVGADTMSCITRFSSVKSRWVTGDTLNLEITHPQDLFRAEHLLTSTGYVLP